MGATVAIEKREPGEEKKEGPSVKELVDKETVDELRYVGWQEEKKEEKEGPYISGKSRIECLATAKAALSKQNIDGSGSLSLSSPLRCSPFFWSEVAQAMRSIALMDVRMTEEEAQLFLEAYSQKATLPSRCCLPISAIFFVG